MSESSPSPAGERADRLVVLGAGLAGLSASVHLRRAGVPHELIERTATAGGLAATTVEAGYRFDRTGHLLHLRDPAIRELVHGVLDPASFVEIDRKSVVFSHGVVTRYPFQANVLGLPKEVAYACVRDFVAAHYDPSPRPVATFEDYCLRHFGEGISRAFMIPYNEKLWGVHPREISARWCDRFVPRPNVDDVLRGAFGVDAPELGYNTRFLYPRLGMGELATALAERAAPARYECEVTSIDWRRRELSAGSERFSYRGLLSTIPLPRLVGLLVDAPDSVAKAAKGLRATSLQYLDVALNTPCERAWHWVYVPEHRYSFYRVGCYSNFSSAMAPIGKASLYVELTTRDDFDLATVLPKIAGELVEIGLIRAPEAIRFARKRRIDPAYVIYDDQRERCLAEIVPFLQENGISSVGRYGAWEYASMEDALVRGRDAAIEMADRSFGAVQSDAT